MKRISLLLVLATWAATAISAEVYRDVDEDGVPVFSDVRTDDSEAVEVREPMTFSNQDFMQQRKNAMAKEEDEPKARVVKYTSLAITDPPHDSAIRDNAGNLTLAVSIKPRVQDGHTAELMMDGKTVRKLAGSGPVSLSNVDRGTHQFKVRILNARGSEIDSGPTSSITVLRYSAR